MEAVAGATLGGLVGALFIVFQGGSGGITEIATGSVVFGSLGMVGWLNRWGADRRTER